MIKKLDHDGTPKSRHRGKGKIKVLFFISSLEGGGAERVMVDLLSSFDTNRIEPLLVLLHPYEHSPYKVNLPEGLRIIVLKRGANNIVEKIKQFVSFVRTIRKEKPAVILSMLTHCNIISLLVDMISRTKVIVGEHILVSEVIKTEEGRNILFIPVSPLIKFLYRFADRIIAVSEGIKTDLVDMFKIAPHKITVIYNPVNIRRITEMSNMPFQHQFFDDHVSVVLGVGRLVEQKRFDVLLKSFKRVVADRDARLVILGEGRDKESLQNLAQELGIDDKVSFPGFQANPYPFFSKACVFVLSSSYEGLPMVLLEALTCGTPIVSTDCKSGPYELLEGGKYGILVPVGDVDALSEGITKVLHDSSLREKLSSLGRERSKEFSIDRIVKSYERVIYESFTPSS